MTFTETEFMQKLKTFVEGCQEIHRKHIQSHYPSLEPDVITYNTKGKRYVKIVRESVGSSGGSVHCFVDKQNGDVLKAASWRAPAKHARGNIFDEHNGLGSMKEYGPAYLR